jgi:hypothetical protein
MYDAPESRDDHATRVPAPATPGPAALDVSGRGAKDLAALLEHARAATPARRIESRDGIAAYGASGIEGVRPWLVDGALAAFAVRVIERAGINGESALASKVLRSARATVPPGVTEDVVWALQQLRVAARPSPLPVVAPVPVAPVRRAAPRSASSSRRHRAG